MPSDERRPVSITLSAMQVDEVVRAAAQCRKPGISALIAGSLRLPAEPSLAKAPSPQARQSAPREPVDRRLSRSLLRGLSLLACFGDEGDPRGIVELAGDLEMSPSTAHRYALTLVELGLLERCPHTRKYRLPGT
jgi:IclR helix-turn-helix domain